MSSILKFYHDEKKGIYIDKKNIKDISLDERLKLVNKKTFLDKKFKIDKNVYMAYSDFIFKITKLLNKEEEIDAISFRDENNIIVIVPPKKYIFWQDKSVEPEEYQISESFFDVLKLLK